MADGLKTQCEYRFLPGMSLGWSWDFLRPIKINGVLHINLHVERMRASRSKPGWGIVVLPAELFNQHGLMFAIKYIAIDALPICAKAIFNA